LFLKDRAVEICIQRGVPPRCDTSPFTRCFVGNGLSMRYQVTNDGSHRLDVRAGGGLAVLEVAWKDDEPLEVQCFKRGEWEEKLLF
jgi:hypothetical protein